MDAFETIAEIAIALTGFTGIVTVLQQRGPAQWTPGEVFRLKSLLWWSLGTMFLAFVPIAIASLGERVPAPWRVAHGIFAVFHTAVFAWFFRQVPSFTEPINRFGWGVIAAGFAFLGAELSVALGFFGGVAPFLYLLALLWFLFLAAGSFAALLFPPEEGVPPAR